MKYNIKERIKKEIGLKNILGDPDSIEFHVSKEILEDFNIKTGDKIIVFKDLNKEFYIVKKIEEIIDKDNIVYRISCDRFREKIYEDKRKE